MQLNLELHFYIFLLLCNQYKFVQRQRKNHSIFHEEQFQKLENITKRSKNIFPVSSKDMIGVDKLIDGIDLILSENFISETLKFGFDKTSYRAKLYDISIVESEKLHEEGYEISVRWSEKRRGEFFHYINSSEL